MILVCQPGGSEWQARLKAFPEIKDSTRWTRASFFWLFQLSGHVLSLEKEQAQVTARVSMSNLAGKATRAPQTCVIIAAVTYFISNPRIDGYRSCSGVGKTQTSLLDHPYVIKMISSENKWNNLFHHGALDITCKMNTASITTTAHDPYLTSFI